MSSSIEILATRATVKNEILREETSNDNETEASDFTTEHKIVGIVETIKNCFGSSAPRKQNTKWTPPTQHTDRFWGNPGVRQWLLGLHDTSSPLQVLVGKYDVLRHILELASWNPACLQIGDGQEASKIGVVEIRDAAFPKPSEVPIDINMMPIDLSDVRTLPECLAGYNRLLFWIYRATMSNVPRTAFITVQEGWVEPGETQRRPGLHTDAPGNLMRTETIGNLRRVTYDNFWWGGCEDGIFIASNISESCRVWNCRVRRVESGYDGVGKFGDCEHLRPLLSDSHTKKGRYGAVEPGSYLDLPANTWYWITDRTPHEALPVKKKCWRQFVRVVVGPVSVWYKSHSTANPKCPVPEGITILEGNKFEGDLKVVRQGDFKWVGS